MRESVQKGLDVNQREMVLAEKFLDRYNSLTGDDEWEMKIYSNFHVEIEFNFT